MNRPKNVSILNVILGVIKHVDHCIYTLIITTHQNVYKMPGGGGAARPGRAASQPPGNFYIYTYTYTVYNIDIFTYMCIDTHIHTHIYIYIYVYIYIYIHTHMASA